MALTNLDILRLPKKDIRRRMYILKGYCVELNKWRIVDFYPKESYCDLLHWHINTREKCL